MNGWIMIGYEDFLSMVFMLNLGTWHLIDYKIQQIMTQFVTVGTIRNDNFQRNTALKCWNTVVIIHSNVATMLQDCVVLKVVIANHLV